MSRNRGLVLVSCLIFVALLAAVGTALYTLTLSQKEAFQFKYDSRQAELNAEAGIHFAATESAVEERDYVVDSFDMSRGTVTVTREPLGARINLSQVHANPALNPSQMVKFFKRFGEEHRVASCLSQSISNHKSNSNFDWRHALVECKAAKAEYWLKHVRIDRTNILMDKSIADRRLVDVLDDIVDLTEVRWDRPSATILSVVSTGSVGGISRSYHYHLSGRSGRTRTSYFASFDKPSAAILSTQLVAAR